MITSPPATYDCCALGGRRQVASTRFRKRAELHKEFMTCTRLQKCSLLHQSGAGWAFLPMNSVTTLRLLSRITPALSGLRPDDGKACSNRKSYKRTRYPPFAVFSVSVIGNFAQSR